MESNYLNLTLTEFLDRCVNNDFGDIEIYDYIRQKTYNFEKEYTCLMYHSVADYAQNYLEKIYPNVKNKDYAKAYINNEIYLPFHIEYRVLTILKNKLSELLTDTELPSIFIPQQVIELLPNMLLVKLQQSGCIKDITVRPLKWEKSKSLLAYFVDVANDKLNLKKGQKRQIKPFETLFNVLGLTDCINEYQNKTGQPPQGYKDIDNLFT